MDLLRELDEAQEGATTTDAAMLERLEEALSRALRQVRRCQRSRSGFLRSLIIAGGRMGDPLDEVQGEIDRCLLDLGFANYVRIAHLETLLRQQSVAATTDDDKKAITGSGAEKDEENATAGEDVTATGVPVCTVLNAGTHEHDHEIVPLPSHGYGYCYWSFSHGHGTGYCWHDYADGPSDTPSSYYTQYQRYTSMFSDDNPNACSII
ncbi:hypothetical protein BAE44_0015855 [Dichanthelium oligosanthes]|uniref:Uncharacterized protein n=1 Tax=Dichanthelium oligosanthes TaxID=888268 RepID=A0A1E5VDA1_9POAL|nr:hypothetical protein BAE44_0015855 [Dichanthelium oligosanthes]